LCRRYLRNPCSLANAKLTNVIASYNTFTHYQRHVLGAVSADLKNGISDAACNRPAGNLIADDQLAATQSANLGGAVAAFQNGGGVHDPGFCSHPVLRVMAMAMAMAMATLPTNKLYRAPVWQQLGHPYA
jgi:2',3'-cyclic-nucleotide 2'-phosphodiesterase (5'-nucleotidase family)